MKSVNLESKLHNIFGSSFYEGPARCRAIAFELHRDGVYNAREYQNLLRDINIHFDGEGAEFMPPPKLERVRMSRRALTVLATKMGALQSVIQAHEQEIASSSPHAIVETGPVTLQVHPKCDRDGKVDLSRFQVVAGFNIIVKSCHRVEV